MPYPNSQHPDQWGWPAHGAGPFDPYSFHGFAFPSGVAAGTGPIWDRVGDLILQHGTQLAGPQELNKDTVDQYNFWGQEDRQSRNSSLWSIHSWGLATDWNSAYNPNRNDSPPDGPYRLPSNFQAILDAEFGSGALLFGGGWGDWMHVEIHMSPDEVHAWVTAHQTPTTPTEPSTGDIDMANVPQDEWDKVIRFVDDQNTQASGTKHGKGVTPGRLAVLTLAQAEANANALRTFKGDVVNAVRDVAAAVRALAGKVLSK